MIRFFVSGWSSRFSFWHSEVIEAKSMAVAKERYTLKFASHRNVKAYELHKH